MTQWPKVNAQMSTHKAWKDIQVLRSSYEHLSRPMFRVNTISFQVSPFWNHLDVWSCLFHRRIARAKSNCFQNSWLEYDSHQSSNTSLKIQRLGFQVKYQMSLGLKPSSQKQSFMAHFWHKQSLMDPSKRRLYRHQVQPRSSVKLREPVPSRPTW